MIPQEVRDVLGDFGLDEYETEQWWTTPIRVLEDKTPKEIHEKGDTKRILDLLEEIKGGFSV
ncbi:MAG: hypothetical protein Q8P07_02445 [bacterium]|nr:hypothetical protein [bacterium]